MKAFLFLKKEKSVNFLTYVFGKGFTGGPDFRLNQTETVNLNGILLEVTLPESNILAAPSSPVREFPFKQEGWFDAHSRRSSKRVSR